MEVAKKAFFFTRNRLLYILGSCCQKSKTQPEHIGGSNMEEKKYISRREQTGFLVGLGGQNMVYSLIGASFFTYFMTDIALFPALVVSVLLIVMKVWDGVNLSLMHISEPTRP